jgi:hypothetical protein
LASTALVHYYLGHLDTAKNLSYEALNIACPLPRQVALGSSGWLRVARQAALRDGTRDHSTYGHDHSRGRSLPACRTKRIRTSAPPNDAGSSEAPEAPQAIGRDLEPSSSPPGHRGSTALPLFGDTWEKTRRPRDVGRWGGPGSRSYTMISGSLSFHAGSAPPP